MRKILLCDKINMPNGGDCMVEMDLQIVRKKKSIEKLITNIKTLTFPVQKIILFGSVLTEKFNEHSDLDLCLICENEENLTLRQKNEIESYFYDTLGEETSVDFIYTTLDKLKNGDKVFKSLREKGRVLWEHIGK
jgi:predicted nucleotidyltransferase